MKSLVLVAAVLLSVGCGDTEPPLRDHIVAAIAAGALIVDVRTPEEFAEGHFPGAINIPHEQIVDGLRARDIDVTEDVILYCRSGNRSGQAERALRAQGYVAVSNAGSLSGLLAATNTPSSQSGR